MTGKKEITLVAPNWLGDAVMSLPLVGMLTAARGVRLSVSAPEATARLYWRIPGVEELLVSPRGGPGHGADWRARLLRRTAPTAVLLLPPSFSSALGPFLARVPIRAGYRTDLRGILLTCGMATNGFRDRHLSTSYLRLGEAALRRMDVPCPERFETPRVVIAAEDDEALGRLLAERGVPAQYAVVVPGATYGPAKSWPWERYRELVSVLSREVTVVLAGTAGERDLCVRIGAGVENVIDVAGETTLGVFAALLARASVVACNDSGSPHLAASLGTPVVVLFGSTSPTWTAPLGPRVEVVRHPVPCSPCFRRTCPTALECFGGIDVEVVLQRIRSASRHREGPTADATKKQFAHPARDR